MPKNEYPHNSARESNTYMDHYRSATDQSIDRMKSISGPPYHTSTHYSSRTQINRLPYNEATSSSIVTETGKYTASIHTAHDIPTVHQQYPSDRLLHYLNEAPRDGSTRAVQAQLVYPSRDTIDVNIDLYYHMIRVDELERECFVESSSSISRSRSNTR